MMLKRMKDMKYIMGLKNWLNTTVPAGKTKTPDGDVYSTGTAL
ncbi:hypothetical protein VQL36_11355 [Chengkuizengella sp. SCS-71B]